VARRVDQDFPELPRLIEGGVDTAVVVPPEVDVRSGGYSASSMR
jgi:hypothetical protein